jgi:hypothetical protein
MPYPWVVNERSDESSEANILRIYISLRFRNSNQVHAQIPHTRLQTSIEFNWLQGGRWGGGGLPAWSASCSRGDKVRSALQRFSVFQRSCRHAVEERFLNSVIRTEKIASDLTAEFPNEECLPDTLSTERNPILSCEIFHRILKVIWPYNFIFTSYNI